MSQGGHLRRGLGRPRDGRLFRGARPRGRDPRRARGADRRAARGPHAVPRARRAGADGAKRRSPDATRSTCATSPTASFSSSASARRRPTRATPTCRASGRSSTSCPELKDGTVLVMKSTVPVGTGEKVRAGLDERGLEHVGYVSNPEFLAEGNAVRDFMAPTGSSSAPTTTPMLTPSRASTSRSTGRSSACDVNSAEMIKLAANAFLMTRISFINEIANVCEATGADVVKVAEGIGLDHRLGPHFLRAGIGYGGSCFPKDSLALKQLASNSGYHFQLLSAVIEVNELQKRRVIGKLTRHLGPLRGRTVALLGLAFKPDTDDMREAPSIVLASRLLAEGATVRAWDPVADGTTLPRGVEVVDSVLEAVRGADAAVIVTEWSELRDLASPEVRAAMATPLIVDGRNLLDPEAVRQAGFAYEGIGRPTSSTDVLPRRRSLEPPVELPRRRLMAPAWKRSSWRAARPNGSATPQADVRRRSSRLRGRPLAAYQVGRLAAAGVTRVIFACAAGQGELFVAELAGLGAEIVAAEEPERLGRGGGIKFAAALRRDERRRLRPERRRAPRRRLRRAARAAPRRRRARDDRRGAAEVAVRRRRGRRPGCRPRLRGGGPRPLLGQLRPVRAHRRGDRAVSRSRRPRVDDVPGARGRRPAARVPPRRPVADREHAEGASHGARPRRCASGVARDRARLASRGCGRSTASDSDRRSRPLARRRAEGREAVGLRADLGAHRRVLRQGAVREGGTVLSLQFHREKEESWLVQSGRATLELGEAGEGPRAGRDRAPARRSTTSRARCTA